MLLVFFFSFLSLVLSELENLNELTNYYLIKPNQNDELKLQY